MNEPAGPAAAPLIPRLSLHAYRAPDDVVRAALGVPDAAAEAQLARESLAARRPVSRPGPDADRR